MKQPIELHYEFWDTFDMYLPEFYGIGFFVNLGFDILKFEKRLHENLISRFWDYDNWTEREDYLELKKDIENDSIKEILIKYYGSYVNILLDEIMQFEPSFLIKEIEESKRRYYRKTRINRKLQLDNSEKTS